MLLQDFGDYQDGYYSVQATEGEQIAQLIAGYIDIILKKVRMCWEGQLGTDNSLLSGEGCRVPLPAVSRQLLAHGAAGGTPWPWYGAWAAGGGGGWKVCAG